MVGRVPLEELFLHGSTLGTNHWGCACRVGRIRAVGEFSINVYEVLASQHNCIPFSYYWAVILQLNTALPFSYRTLEVIQAHS